MTPGESRAGAKGKTGSSLFPVTLVGLSGFGLVLFLGWQNLGLRGDVVRGGRTLQTLEETIAWNIQVSSIEGTLLPAVLMESLQAEIGGASRRQSSQTLLIVYTPTVCVSCLRAGLWSIQSSRANIEAEGISPHALAGERRGSGEFALLLREDQLLSFPITFVPADDLQDSLPFGREPGFTDTPLYLLLDNDLKIRSAFKADQRRSDLLDQWLAAHTTSVSRVSDAD